jgi:uncharacterized membrane protein YhaH (DUF805 family)
MNWYWKVLKSYADFKGRARRKEYWYYGLFNAAILMILLIGSYQKNLFMVLYVIYGLGTFIPSVAVGVRQLHDMGKSGYWAFLIFVPLLGGIALIYYLCQPSQSGENAFGAVPE